MHVMKADGKCGYNVYHSYPEHKVGQVTGFTSRPLYPLEKENSLPLPGIEPHIQMYSPCPTHCTD